MTAKLQIVALGLLGTLLIGTDCRAARTDDNTPHKPPMVGQSNPMGLEEVVIAPESRRKSWELLYTAYSCIYHQQYGRTEQWLMSASPAEINELLLARDDIAYLTNALNDVASTRKQASVQPSDVEVAVLQALIKTRLNETEDALDLLKRLAINNPTHRSIEQIKVKIKLIELELADNSWSMPLDVMQTGGKQNQLNKWLSGKLPLKVYIPTDDANSKLPGYKSGDAQLLRNAFDTWQKQSNGKIQFTFVQTVSKADITCTWVSEQAQLQSKDAAGVCERSVNNSGHILRANLKLLTLTPGNYRRTFNDDARKRCIATLCLHEIGHSIGLNHSSNKQDIMWTHIPAAPVGVLTTADTEALKSLYQSNVRDDINAVYDHLRTGDNKAALAALNNAALNDAKDSQTRDTICYLFATLAKAYTQNHDNKTAIDLLLRAKLGAAKSQSKSLKTLVLNRLQYAYLQTGNTKQAENLEHDPDWPQTKAKPNASHLDAYGMTKESVPFYEKALNEAPNDPSVREKFCLLLVALAKDEMNAKNETEAITLLTRAKSSLQRGMSIEVIAKVMYQLRQAYLQTERGDDADQTVKDLHALTLQDTSYKKYTTSEALGSLTAAAKIKHPQEWKTPAAAKMQSDKIRQAYDKYARTLRQYATTMKLETRTGWGASFVIKASKHVGKTNFFDQLFASRNELIKLTDENAVIGVECASTFAEE
ncbi:MAG: Matrixin family metalloprotease [Cyanobacteriota bacterium erpe_2018_sw_39hr_WHONDRS-SW48-000098_B_bin.30]|nr:Matrixin family metalloprotease [Cyanobacteriota bacterium erpe_2018_sw_39hr_WHONDRS-SW48-000098_B_bin.30]